MKLFIQCSCAAPALVQFMICIALNTTQKGDICELQVEYQLYYETHFKPILEYDFLSKKEVS